MQGHVTTTPVWFEQPGALHRVICDLVFAELAALRRRTPSPPLPWPAELSLTRDLGADSLELLSLATRLSEMLHIHRSGIEDYLLVKNTIEDWASVAFTSLQQFSSELTFHTSGSSGTPKPCTHHSAWLWQEVQALSAVLTPRKRVLSAVPSHPIYGFLFTVMLPVAMGLKPGKPIDLRASSAAWLAGKVQAGDLIIGHPDYWNEVQRAGVAFPADVVGVSSGAPCPDDVARKLRLAGLRLVQVFGSSETAGLGWRDNETLPYRCLPYWQPGNDGKTLVRTLPDASQANFTLQDHLTWVDTNHFVPTGRRDHMVQVGGVNVLPAKAAAALKEHPEVQDAIVRLMRADEGNRLKAFVVPRNSVADTDDLANKLGRWVGEKLTAPERPATFTFGPQLPKQGNSKPADWII